MLHQIAKLAQAKVNLVTLESLLKQGLLDRALNTSNPTILTTVEYDTHIKYWREIEQLKANHHIRVVPFYSPLIYSHYSESGVIYEHADNPRKVSLLIGDNNQHMLDSLDKSRIVSLQELCRALPEKVPFFIRPKNNTAEKEKLEKRLGITNPKEKTLQFQHILLINPSVKMWDQAFQVILDCQPTPLFIPYLKPATQGDLYRLSVDDFVRGLTKIHETVSSVVKTHPPLNLVRFDQRRQLSWIISEIANEASQMAIDPYFFTQAPKIDQCGGAVRLVESLADIL